MSESLISYDDFARVDIRCGTIVAAEVFARAKNPSYKIKVDFGPVIGTLQTSAQVTVNYSCDQLIGRKVMGCVNLAPKNIAGFTSQFLLLGFSDRDNAIVLATSSSDVPNGQKLH